MVVVWIYEIVYNIYIDTLWMSGTPSLVSTVTIYDSVLLHALTQGYPNQT